MKISFYIIFLILITVLSGCKQDPDVVSPETPSAQLTKDVSLSVPEFICANEEFIVSLDSKYKTGKLQIQISKDEGHTWTTAAESYSGYHKNSENFYLNLEYGNYKLRGKVNSERTTDYSEVLERTVSECQDCEGLVLDPDLSGGDFVVNAGESRSFTAEYTVIACDKDYYSLKLSGEILSRARFNSTYPAGAEVKKISQNTSVSWYLGDVKRGYAKTFKVTFDLNVPKAPYGSLIPLTSGFVLEGKSSNGSQVRVGDYNEIFVQVQ